MTNYIKRIEIEGALGRFDIIQDFGEGVNVLFGKNGTGKTTLLHILANLLNGNYRRFAFIEFRNIQATLGDGTDIKISQTKDKKDSYVDVFVNGESIREKISTNQVYDEELSMSDLVYRSNSPAYREKVIRARRLEESEPILPSAYFPAFRTMIEAWASVNANAALRDTSEVQNATTNFARELFGSFVPNLNYPSPLDIEREISSEIEAAILKVSRADREYFGELATSFFQSLSQYLNRSENDTIYDENEDSEAIIEEINSLINKLDEYPLKIAPSITKLRSSVSSIQLDAESKKLANEILNIYRDALREVVSVQEESFRGIEAYLNSVNSFLEGKSLEISLPESRARRKSSIEIRFDVGTTKPIRGIRRALSSGERQIVTLVYATTHMSKQQVVLIDEPEISLHVDWQRHLLKEMSEQLGDRQVIVCTHSPVIGADYEDRVIIFQPTVSCSPVIRSDNDQIDEEDIEVD